jgi:hypothetical protein
MGSISDDAKNVINSAIMLRAIRQTGIVLPGGRLEVQSSELPEGSTVEIIVMVEEEIKNGTPPSATLSSIIGSAPGSFATPDEADAFIRSERDR